MMAEVVQLWGQLHGDFAERVDSAMIGPLESFAKDMDGRRRSFVAEAARSQKEYDDTVAALQKESP